MTLSEDELVNLNDMLEFFVDWAFVIVRENPAVQKIAEQHATNIQKIVDRYIEEHQE